MKKHSLLSSILVFATFMFLILAIGKAMGQEPALSPGNASRNENFAKQDYWWVFFTKENTGLSTDQIGPVIYDDYGNLWIGTYYGGLVKYDGVTWKVYNKENSWLPHNTVRSLAIDNDGNLWIGTSGNGLSKFDGTDWRVYIPANSQIPDVTINSIAFDSDNNIWLATSGSGLVKVEGLSIEDEPVWTFYTRENSELPENILYSLLFDETGYLWLGTESNDLTGFDGSTFTTYTPPVALSDKTISSLANDEENHLWIGYTVGLIAEFDGTDWNFHELDESGISPSRAYSLTFDKDDNLWISTEDGLLKYTGDDWVIINELSNESSAISPKGKMAFSTYYSGLFTLDGNTWEHFKVNNTGLPENGIMAIEVDKNGNAWAGLWYGGLTKFNGLVWKSFTATDTDLPHEDVRTIVADDENNLWIGTGNGLAMIPAISIEGQPWKLYTTGNTALPSNSIRRLHYGNGNLWIGTSLGLTRYNGDNWETYTTDNSPLPQNSIHSITTDIDGNIWVGTYGGGLCFIPALSLGMNDWEVYTTDNSDLPDNSIFALEADSSGNIWIGTRFGGLVKFDGTEFTVYNTDNSDLPDNHVYSLKTDRDKRVWVGLSYNGVVRIDGENWTLFNSGNAELPEGPVYAIDVDEYDNKWIGIDGFGLAVYNEDGVSIDSYKTIMGHLFYNSGESPLNESTVEIYRTNNPEYQDRQVLSGTNAYQFIDLEGGMYTIKVIPDTLSYPETLPTWLGYELTRAGSHVIILYEDITSLDINIISRPAAGIGQGTVKGTLVEDETGKEKSAVIMKSDVKGTPVKDCYVFLVDKTDDKTEAFDITNDKGEFMFKNIEPGEYEFIADYMGIPMDESNPALNVSDTQDTLLVTAVAGQEYIGIETEIISSVAEILMNEISVYPVPVKDNLSISFDKDINQSLVESIKIINLNGKVLYDHSSAINGASIITIDMSRFDPGIYILDIKVGEKNPTVKIIKE
ncbi:MAG: two-component regulator propeller domain-containing protein [Bacteroidota bacterium]